MDSSSPILHAACCMLHAVCCVLYGAACVDNLNGQLRPYTACSMLCVVFCMVLHV
jgi:hypothetical protein